MIKRKSFLQLSQFLEDVIVSWLQHHFHQPESSYEIQNQVLWYNRNILNKDQPLFIKQLFEKGILYINSLLNSKGEIVSMMT